MRLVSYWREGEVRPGALLDGWVVDLPRSFRALREERPGHAGPHALPGSMGELLLGGPTLLDSAGEAVELVGELLSRQGAEELRYRGLAFAREEVVLKPCLSNPGKILCLGLNYRDHARETGVEPPEVPLLFAKFPNALVGPAEPIVLPAAGQQVDLEAELAVVIGRRARHLREEEALEFVAGYAAFNDVSARDLQFMSSQFTPGKMPDTFGPIGPLVTRDEVPDPHDLEIASWIDELPMQRSSTEQMIFRINQILAFVSRLATLEPGDIIATGTPAGVGFVRQPPIFLKPGQTAVVEVERLGRLENPVVGKSP